MDVATLRTYTGLDTATISDEALAVIITLAEDWCRQKAASYGGARVPEAAVLDASVAYLRQNLDLRGIKPSSISMPDLSMSTDVNAAVSALFDRAEASIKASATGSGRAFRHLRAGKVPRWRRHRWRQSSPTASARRARSTNT